MACTSSTGFVLGIVTGPGSTAGARAAAAPGARAAAKGGDGDIEDGEGASAGSEGDAGAGGEDDKDDNGPGAANEEDDAGEASRSDLATTLGAKKASAVSGQPPCLSLSPKLSVSGLVTVRRTPSPGCPIIWILAKRRYRRMCADIGIF